MLVRCGSCRVELEVQGPGEFACPACGSRNVVREQPAPQGPTLDLPDLGRAASPPSEPAAGIRWTKCPQCSYRFAVGEVPSVACPSCSANLSINEDGVATISP